MKTMTDRFRIFLALAFTSLTANAALLAYEGFNYETNKVGSLSGLQGGEPVSDFGWSGGWGHEYLSAKGDANSKIALGSLTKTGVRSTGNRAVFFRKFWRKLETEIRKTEGEVWIGFFCQIGTSKATGSIEIQDSARSEGAPVTVAYSAKSNIKLGSIDVGTMPGTAQHFLLFKVTFSTEGNCVSLWLDPDLANGMDEETEPSAVLETTENWGITGVRFINNSGTTNTYTVDEIRIGDTARDAVWPIVQSISTTVILH
ncbi:MAG: hypothetical protein ACI4QT_09495 [Kiritimatiellia bacterium]